MPLEQPDALDQLEEGKLVHWRERNRMAAEQSQQRMSRPLNDYAVLQRLRKRLSDDGVIAQMVAVPPVGANGSFDCALRPL